jgi:hypothetical protein
MDKMAYFVCFVGALTAACAITTLFKPNWFKNFIGFIQKGRVIYVLIGLKNTIGIIFLIFARECRWTVFIILLGVLITSGTTLFCMLPLEKIKAYLNWWHTRPVWVYRVCNVFTALFGFLLIWGGMPKVGR